MNEKRPGGYYADRMHQNVAVRRLRTDELDRAIAMLRAKIPAATASNEAIHRVHRHNPDSIWGIFRRGEEGVPNAQILGFFCLLPMTEEGARQMREQTFNSSDPDVTLLVRQSERPTAVYFWAIVAEGLTVPAGPMIFIALGPNYEDVPLYVRPTTEAGLKRVQRSDFYRPVIEGRDKLYDLFSMARYPELDKLKEILGPAKPSTQVLESRIQIKVASTPAEMEMAMRIRAVYLVEQNCPYEEEYDGNDYCGTTFLAFWEGEPAGTLRVRYFGEFVKFERMTVLPRFRGRTTVAREIVKAAVAFCARKGFRKGYGHAQQHAMQFWARFGFKPIDTNRKLVFSDHEYIEFEGEFPVHDSPITMRADPYLLLRPEGRWDEEGVLDRSSTRPATNPH
ncbi:MAG TPA: GNAT family N-acetyltransferase [Rhizomicrobium sp.]|jgi:predicted GNAT family N-acyltransferase